MLGPPFCFSFSSFTILDSLADKHVQMFLFLMLVDDAAICAVWSASPRQRFAGIFTFEQFYHVNLYHFEH